MGFFRVLAFCLLAVLNVKAASDTPHCEKDAESFGQCMKTQHDKNKDDDNAKLDKVSERIAQCFQDNDCRAPDPYTKELELFRNVKNAWDTLSKEAKSCVASALSRKTFELVNQCLKDQKVDQIKEPNFEDSDLDEFSDETLPHRRLFKGFQQVILSLKQCRADEGGKAVNATVGCMASIKQDIKEEVCKRIEQCRKDKVSDFCHQQGQQIHQALCTCGKNKIKEYIKTVEGLEVKGKDIAGEDLALQVCKTCKDDLKDLIGNVQKCFQEKKVVAKPDDKTLQVLSIFLTATIHDPTGPMHAVLVALKNDSPTFSKSDLGEVRQILNDILTNFDCGCSQVSRKFFV